MQSEPDLLAGGLDLSIVEAAGCAAEPGGRRFRDCSQIPKSAEVMVNAQPGATVSGICPGGGIVRRRNERGPPFLYCALGIPRISRRGRGL